MLVDDSSPTMSNQVDLLYRLSEHDQLRADYDRNTLNCEPQMVTLHMMHIYAHRWPHCATQMVTLLHIVHTKPHCVTLHITVSHCVTLSQTVSHCISHKIYIEVGCSPNHTTFTLLHCPTLNINIELVCIFPFLTLQIYLKITNCRILLNILSVTCACVQCACLHKRLHTLVGSALFHNGWFSSGCLFSMA